MCLAVVVKDDYKGTIASFAPYTISNEFVLFNNRSYLHRSSGNFIYNEHHCTSSIPSSSARIVFVNYDGVAKKIQYYTNGLLSTNTTVTGSPADVIMALDRKITLGIRDNFTPQEYLKGTLYEVIAYNDTLSSSDRAKIETYLRQKYNIINNGCGNLTDAEEFSTDNSLNIYPNPVSGKVKVEFNLEIPNLKNQQIELVNTLGKVVGNIDTQNNGNSIEMDLSNLAKGIYFLRISIADGWIVKKIIKD
jgi:hypothetical protein